MSVAIARSVAPPRAPSLPLAAFVTLRWKGELYAAEHVSDGQTAALGEGEGSLAPLDTEGSVVVAEVVKGVPLARIPAGIRARFDGSGAPTRILLGPARVPLAEGERVELRLGAFVVRIEGALREGRPRHVPRAVPTRVLLGAAVLLQAAFLLCGALARGVAPEEQAADDARVLRALWVASAERVDATEPAPERSLGTEPSPREQDVPVPAEELACVGEAVVLGSPEVAASPDGEGFGSGALGAVGGGLSILAAGVGLLAWKRRAKASV